MKTIVTNKRNGVVRTYHHDEATETMFRPSTPRNKDGTFFVHMDVPRSQWERFLGRYQRRFGSDLTIRRVNR